MDLFEVSQLNGQISAAHDAAKDVENELFRMQTQLISLLKKYEGRTARKGIPERIQVAEEEEDPAIVIESKDDDPPSSYNSNYSCSTDENLPSLDFTGHQDKTARLDDSEDDDGLHPIDSLEIAKKNKEKNKTQSQSLFQRHGLLGKFDQRYNTTKESPKEVSDESGDDSFRTPSSSYSDLLSSGDSNREPIIEEESDNRDITETESVEADACGDVEVGEVIEKFKGIAVGTVIDYSRFADGPKIESERKVIPPLNLPPIFSPPKTPDRDRIDSSDSEPFTIVAGPSEPQTPIRIAAGPPAQSSTPHNPPARSSTPNFHRSESPRRTISQPAATRTTPVDIPGRGYETLPADSSISSCPMCNLSFEEDHDTSYRNFHANACIDRFLGK